MENEKLLIKRSKITTLFFIIISVLVIALAAKPAWNFVFELARYETWANSFSELPRFEKGAAIFLMFILFMVALGISYLLARTMFCILFIKHIDIYRQAQTEKNLNEHLAVTEDLINQDFHGCRVAIVQEWNDVDTNLQYNVNYFLKKFTEKIVIVDIKKQKNKVMIYFKMK